MALVRSNQSAVGSGVKTFVGLALLTAGFLATLATILGFLGSLWWAFDVLANFRLQYTVVLILTAALYGIAFGRATSILFLIVAGINVIVILPLFTAGPAGRNGVASLSIVSYNASGGVGAGNEFARWLDDSEADLAFVLDTTETWIEPVETASGYTIQNSLPIDRRFGITLLAKESADVELLRLGDRREPALRVETSVDGRAVVVYAVQPDSPTSETGAERNHQLMDELAELVNSETLPVVVVGDLSLTPWNSGYRSFVDDTGLVSSIDGQGFQATWPADGLPGLAVPYDHAFHSGTLTTVERATGPGFGSSHRVLFVEIGIAAA